MDVSSKELLEKKRWSRLLRSLRVGVHKFQLDVKDIHSLRMVAYRMNKVQEERNLFTLNVAYKSNIVVINVTRR